MYLVNLVNNYACSLCGQPVHFDALPEWKKNVLPMKIVGWCERPSCGMHEKKFVMVVPTVDVKEIIG